MEKENKEIPFGAKDSELYKFEYTIPEGYEAEIKYGKVIMKKKKKESEDERIRTALLRCCDDWEKGQFGCMAKKDVPAIRAYLEKQKEQKPFSQEVFDAAKHEALWGKQKPAEWSEEDEAGLSDTLWAINQARAVAKDENDMGNIWCAENWIKNRIKSLRPQPKQEWSENDEDMLNSIIATCQLAAQDRDSGPARHLLEMQERFLKSLRSRPKSSDNWKPSKKQIDALNSIILTGSFTYVGQTQDLISLKDDLKKLL